jgi:hypothetical protein
VIFPILTKGGLLINFNVPTLKQGVKRVACGDLFREETGGRGFVSRVLSLLCASVQGWQKSRIYADFIFTTTGGGKGEFRKVFVLETKGLHLKNENTAYKESVFALCNKHAKKKTWNELVPAMRDKEISYEVVFQDEWEKRLNELLT